MPKHYKVRSLTLDHVGATMVHTSITMTGGNGTLLSTVSTATLTNKTLDIATTDDNS